MPIKNLEAQIRCNVSDRSKILYRIFHKRVQDLTIAFFIFFFFPQCGVLIFFCVQPLESSLSFATRFDIDIVGTVYHFVIYMQSNKIQKVFQ